MTTHEGADMSTHPEVVTLDPNDAEQMEQFLRRLMNERDFGPNAHSGFNFTWENVTDALRAMTVPPPEEPSLWSVAKVFNRLFVRGQSPDADGRWFEVSPGQGMYAVTWSEVCALGTPEVLEPESVKALREQVNRYDAWLERVADALAEARGVRVHWSDLDTSVKALVDRAEKAEREVEEFIAIDEEPAPVEVTEEPIPGTHLVSLKTGDKWHRTMGCERWHNDTLGSNCDSWDDLLLYHGPMSAAESPC